MKYQSLYDIYMDEVKKMATSQDDWKAFLEYASKMYGYKFSTLVTAFAQSPNYTQLVTYEQWNKLGYRIRRGEKSTPVLMDNFYKMSHMFDVTQLEKKAVIKNWMVKDTEREIFKQRFIANSKTLNGSFDDIKAIKIVQGLDVLYCQPGNQNLGHYEELLYQSIDYMISERCNLKYEVKIPKIELSPEQMTAIGWAAISVARDILLESKEIVNELRREEQLGRNENIIQGEGRNTVRNSERGTSTRETKQVFNGSKETLGEDERTRIGKSDHSREDDGEDERDRKRDREQGDSTSNSDSEEKSVDDKRRDIEDVRAESNSGSSIEKLEEKLSELRQKQALMKNVNAFYRKNKTLKGCPHLSEKNIEKMEGNIEGKPFPSYMLTNNNQNIHRIENRINKLKEGGMPREKIEQVIKQVMEMQEAEILEEDLEPEM